MKNWLDWNNVNMDIFFFFFKQETVTEKDEENFVAAKNEENTKVSASVRPPPEREETPVIENIPAKPEVKLRFTYKEGKFVACLVERD